MELVKKVCLTLAIVIILLSVFVAQLYRPLSNKESGIVILTAFTLILTYMMLRTIQNRANNNPAWFFSVKIKSIIITFVSLIFDIFQRFF